MFSLVLKYAETPFDSGSGRGRPLPALFSTSLSSCSKSTRKKSHVSLAVTRNLRMVLPSFKYSNQSNSMQFKSLYPEATPLPTRPLFSPAFLPCICKLVLRFLPRVYWDEWVQRKTVAPRLCIYCDIVCGDLNSKRAHPFDSGPVHI